MPARQAAFEAVASEWCTQVEGLLKNLSDNGSEGGPRTELEYWRRQRGARPRPPPALRRALPGTGALTATSRSQPHGQAQLHH